MKNITVHPSCQIPNLAQIYSQWLNQDEGHFVEIGAFDGFTYSNTYCLAEIGWSGLYVEPLEEFVATCKKYHEKHPKIAVEQICVGETRGQIKLYTHGEVSSVVWDQNTRDWGCSQDRFKMVECDILDNVLAVHKTPKEFELLVIDVEGAEIQVLNGFTVEQLMPKMVIIEAHEKDVAAIRNWKAAPINDYFAKAGYRKIQADHINSIFVSPSQHRAVLGVK